MKLFAPLLIVGAGLTHVAQTGFDRVSPPVQHETSAGVLPSIEALRLLSLGFDTLAADYYWLRALSYFGTNENHAIGYPLLPDLVERASALDPDFESVYVFAGTALTIEPFDGRAAERILERGVEREIDDWRVPFLLGFTRYYNLHDYTGAAEALAVAAPMEGTPDYVGSFALRLAAEAAEPEIGLRMIDSIMDSIDDEGLRQAYLHRRKLLVLEQQLGWLDEALRRFAAARGKPATTFEELVAVGLLKRVPTDPLGGRYFVGDDGRATTTSHTQRLRLPDMLKREGRP